MTSRKKRSAVNGSANRFRLPSRKTIVVSTTTLISTVTLLCLKDGAAFTRPASSMSVQDPTSPPATPSNASTSEQEAHARSFILVTSSAPTPVIQWFLLTHHAAPASSSSPVINAASNALMNDPLLVQSLTLEQVAPLPSVVNPRSRTARKTAPASAAEPSPGLKALVHQAAKRFVALLRRPRDLHNQENQDLRQLLEQQERDHRQALQQVIEQQERDHRQALQKLLEEQERKQRQALKLQKREKDLQRRFQLRQARQAWAAERERSKAIRVEREWRLYLAVPTGEKDLVVYQVRAFGLPWFKQEEGDVWVIVLLYASIFGISLAGTASWETDESEAIPIDQQLLADSACCCDEDDHDTPTAVVNVTIGAENIDASPLIAEDLKTIVRDPVASREISHAIPAAADRHFAFDAALDVSHDAFVRKPVTSNATDRSTKARSFIELSPPITCLLPKKSIPSQGTFNEDAKTAVDAAKKVRQEVLFTSGSWYKQCQTKTIYEHDRMWNDGEEVTFEKEQRKTIQKQLENSPSHHVLNEAQDTALARSAEDAQVDAQDLARVISETAEEVLPDPTWRNSLEMPGAQYLDEVESTVGEPHVPTPRIENLPIIGVSTEPADELFTNNPVKDQNASLTRSEDENDAREGAGLPEGTVEGALSEIMIAEGVRDPRILEDPSEEQGIEGRANSPVQDDGEGERTAHPVHEGVGVTGSSSSRDGRSYDPWGALVQPLKLDDEAEKVDAIGTSEYAPCSPLIKLDDYAQKVEALATSENSSPPNKMDDHAEKVEAPETSEKAPCSPLIEMDGEAEKVEALGTSENAPCSPLIEMDGEAEKVEAHGTFENAPCSPPIKTDDHAEKVEALATSENSSPPNKMDDHAEKVEALGTSENAPCSPLIEMDGEAEKVEAHGTFENAPCSPPIKTDDHAEKVEALATSENSSPPNKMDDHAEKVEALGTSENAPCSPLIEMDGEAEKVEAHGTSENAPCSPLIEMDGKAEKVEALGTFENAPCSPPIEMDGEAEKVEALATSENVPCLPPKAFQPRVDFRRDYVLTLPQHLASVTIATWPVRMLRFDHAPPVDCALGTDSSPVATNKGDGNSSVFSDRPSGVTFPCRVYLPRSSFEDRASSFLQSRSLHPPALDRMDDKALQGSRDALFPCVTGEDLDRASTNAPHIAEEQPFVDFVDEDEQHDDARISGVVDDNLRQDPINAARPIEQRVIEDVNADPTAVDTELQHTADQAVADAPIPEAKKGKTRRGTRGSGKNKKAKRVAEAQAKNTQGASQGQGLASKDRPTQQWNGLQARFLPPPTRQFAQQPAQASRYQSQAPLGAFGQMVNAHPNFALPWPPYMGPQCPHAMPQFGYIPFASPSSRPLYENHAQDCHLAHSPLFLSNARTPHAANAFAWGSSIHQPCQVTRPQLRSKAPVADDPTDYDVSGYVFRHSRPRQQVVAESALQTSQSDPGLHAFPERGKSSYTGRLRSGTGKSIS